MKIAGTQYTLDKNSFEIYLSGCRHRCSENCHNKELWDYMIGDDYNEDYFNKIKEKLENFGDIVDKISIFGGEPLDQNINQLYDFLKDMKSLNKEIWLFTSYELSDVPENIKGLCDYIKTGTYDESLKCETESYGYILASSNQKIHKIS